MPNLFRKATLKDVKTLLEIENACFNTDQISARSFKRFIETDPSLILVLERKKKVAGYGILLFNKGTSLARLYSLAVHPEYRKLGLGAELLKQLEKEASENHCSYLRLEVHQNNAKAIALYERMGYRKFDHKLDYYQDHGDAFCYEKKVQVVGKGRKVKVPYYMQTTEFTCGPSCLMMAMAALNRKRKLTRTEEIRLWREATTVFMTSGHGGCGPHGLALAAHHRGFKAEVFVNTNTTLFIQGVRDQKKKKVIELVQQDFEEQLHTNKIKVNYRNYNCEDIRNILDNGGVPIVLLSSYRLSWDKSPHWVVITNHTGDFVFINDSDPDEGEIAIDNIDIPVRIDEFNAMTLFGREKMRTMVAIYPNR